MPMLSSRVPMAPAEAEDGSTDVRNVCVCSAVGALGRPAADGRPAAIGPAPAAPGAWTLQVIARRLRVRFQPLTLALLGFPGRPAPRGRRSGTRRRRAGASLASAAAAAPARLAAPPATQTLPARLPDGVRPRAAHGDVDDTLAEPLLASELLPCQRAVVDEAPCGQEGEEASTLILEVRLALGDGTEQALQVRAAERCRDAAARFVREHCLKPGFEAPLAAYLLEAEGRAESIPARLEADLSGIRMRYRKR